MQVDYDRTIKNSIETLLECYDQAPTETIEKYDSLFSFLLRRKERKPITHNRFTFYPSAGRIISFCGKHVIQLSHIQNEIFYLLAKSLSTGNHVNQEVLYNYIYQNNPKEQRSHLGYPPHPNTLKVHIYKINIKISPLNLMIRHKGDFGWAIRTEKEDILPMNDNKAAFSKNARVLK